MDDASRIGEARRHAAQLAASMAWNSVDMGRLALVVTELATNLHRHSQSGRLLIAARPQAGDDLELIAIDNGPGIPNIPLAMRDGFSSSSTPGTGLGAIHRLADTFDLYSVVPDGTVAVARVRSNRATAAASAFGIGAICLPAPHETVCGDGWALAFDEDQGTLMVADGLGHGPEAAKASQAAITAFADAPGGELADILQTAHRALQTTRGAAVCVLRFDRAASAVSFTGAGNVVGRVVSGVFDKSLITQHGTAGLQIRKPSVASLELPQHALVLLHSDGIETRWNADRIRPLLQRDPALVAAVLLRDHTRHRDDATVVVMRTEEHR